MVGLGVVGGVLAFGGRANAVETVRLVFESNDAVVSLDDIRAFAQTGQPPAEIEQFLLDNGQPAEVIARLLTEEITLSENLRQRIRTRLEESSIGQFILYEIDKIVQGSGDITALKNALDRTMEDRTISVLELLENYTDANQVTVNLVGLRQTYTDVKNFVERVIPALEVARDFLQNAICECETPQQTDANPETDTDTTSSPQSQNHNIDLGTSVAAGLDSACLSEGLTANQLSSTQP
ncbi:alpha/beta hydrolase [Egbenema bharatensis]|uniref:alpha/beta hydrolase n=1 Tax=Egbenema bharatensis TaxID=3463334 RepID=UPI003A85F60C